MDYWRKAWEDLPDDVRVPRRPTEDVVFQQMKQEYREKRDGKRLGQTTEGNEQGVHRLSNLP